jgi:chorismate mutase/prephenate dehydratase
MNDKQQLSDLRKRIDELDEKIQALINERARCATEVAKVKSTTENSETFYRPEREAEVLRTVVERNHGPLSPETMARIFREIMSACLALEQPIAVAFLGPEGSFSEEAVFKQFGHAVKPVPLTAIDEVFREVESGSAEYGLVPVENSTEGGVNQTLDLLPRTALKICGEVNLRIHDHLMSREKDIGNIQRIYSHSQSLAQCREWLDGHLGGVERVAVSSNSEAARRAADEDGAAAVAGTAAAECYGLAVLAENIEDDPNNTTRFVVLGRESVPPSGNDKTSLVVSNKNEPGSLFRLIQPLAGHGISMTRIESRPSRQALWEYLFFIDIEGHVQDPEVAKALAELEKETAFMKLLGSFPKAVL